MDTRMDTALVTVSYGPDFHRCQRLCRTIDQHVVDYKHHLVIVPAQDVAQFSSLAGPKREVIAIESMMPGRYRQLPFSNWSIMAQWLPIPRVVAMRGWIVQQLVKLAAYRATDAQILCMIDSDVQFCRRFSCSSFVTDGKVRLQTVPWDNPPSPLHPTWQQAAERILGLEPAPFRFDYIGNMITWHRDDVQSMLAHIEATHGKPWYIVVGRELRFSEYILFGNYIDRVLKTRSHHINQCPHYCFELWDMSEVEALQRGETQLNDEQVAILIQSKLRLSSEQEQALIATLGAE